MNQALIMSIGTSPEPIVVSIAAHRPELVVFFASEQTIESIGAIKARLEEQNFTVKNRNVMTSDAEDLEACYVKALECAEIALDGGRPVRDVVVDFTGGTKAMIAALTLATVGKGFAFSYVGGNDRSKNRGIVTTGSERIVRRRDPFVLYAVHERRRLAQYFNRYQFQAAETVARNLQARLILEADGIAFEFIGDVAAGYEGWDRFQFDQALQRLKSALRKLAPAARANSALRYADLYPTIEAHISRLELIQQKTHRGQDVDPVLAEELLANAARRAEEGKFDDAIVRLYRALELGGQVAVQRTLGCGTDKVPADKIPLSLRDEYRQRYENQTNFVQLPLHGTFRLLDALGEPEGKQFVSRAGEFRKIQSARNSSWLAHGLSPCRDETYGTLSLLVREILGIDEGPGFPKLDEAV